MTWLSLRPLLRFVGPLGSEDSLDGIHAAAAQSGGFAARVRTQGAYGLERALPHHARAHITIQLASNNDGNLGPEAGNEASALIAQPHPASDLWMQLGGDPWHQASAGMAQPGGSLTKFFRLLLLEGSAGVQQLPCI